jgi:hypothetical protein
MSNVAKSIKILYIVYVTVWENTMVNTKISKEKQLLALCDLGTLDKVKGFLKENQFETKTLVGVINLMLEKDRFQLVEIIAKHLRRGKGVRPLIDRCGGVDSMAILCGVETSAVSKWIVNHHIPKRHFISIYTFLDGNSDDVDRDILLKNFK